MSSPAADPADLAFAIELAEDAGASTLAWFQSATGRRTQGGWFAGDRRRPRRRSARPGATCATHPGDGIIGEEDDDVEGSTGRRWVVDPIDGTKAFTKGVPLYATLIALIDDHGPAVGVIHLPALGETIAAAGDSAAPSTARPAGCRDTTRSTVRTPPPAVLGIGPQRHCSGYSTATSSFERGATPTATPWSPPAEPRR